MFGFGVWEIVIVGAVVVFALVSGRNIPSAARQAGRLTGLWMKIRGKLNFLGFLRR